ncbi:ArsR/SmtB family transcription factor [Arthrobacter sp.]|uniref:ArsR/SmtB family transcription factor n=1 Tax=Arthrobacter sp. TaxID=1667 RepID=UPI0028118F0B|nr:metalloregulator ArsR/SmtB family transcription factor [Arthrobacter sp.]
METFPGAHRPLYEVKANLFKGMAHPVRVRVLEILSAAPDVSVTDLILDMNVEASRLSQHLSVLKTHHLVVSERRGSQVFYSLAYPRVAELLATAKMLLGEVLESTQQQLLASEWTAPQEPAADTRGPSTITRQ